MDKQLTLKDIAGYATSKTVWQMMLNLSSICGQGRLHDITSTTISIVGKDFIVGTPPDASRSVAFAAPETFNVQSDCASEASEVWAIGALAFYVITGMDVFEGNGGMSQTATTDVPRISSAHAQPELSQLIRQCLNYSPTDRPSKEEIASRARNALAQPSTPRQRLSNQQGKSYTRSLIRFWPEEMVPLIFALMLFATPLNLFSQQAGTSTTSIPEELATLVMRCVDLRSAKNIEKVSKAMERDMSWTMMDELPLDKKGECTTADPVDIFGLNDIGFRILKRRGGIANAAGRFRDGRDPRYKYSFIEVTAKKGATVHYKINGREGEQLFAIIPFDEGGQFTASIPNGETFTDNGVSYIRLRQRLKKTDSFMLTITNQSKKNMAFGLINYNSRNNE